MLVILSQKVDTASSYSDELFNAYHYPAKYRKQLHEGDIFIYYQGNRHDKSHRYYFGVGTVGEIMTTDGENYYARLVNCRKFEKKVPIYLPDGGYVEQLGYESIRNSINPPWQSSVRPLSEKAFAYILNEAGKQQVPEKTESLEDLKEKLKAAVRAFYVEKNASAVYHIESIAAAIGRVTDISEKREFEPYKPSQFLVSEELADPIKKESDDKALTASEMATVVKEPEPAVPESNATVVPVDQVRNEIRRILKKDFSDKASGGATIGNIQAKAAQIVGELKYADVKDILKAEPWAKLNYGRWYYTEAELDLSNKKHDSNTSTASKTEKTLLYDNTKIWAMPQVQLPRKQTEARFADWIKKDPAISGYSNAYLAGLRNAEQFALRNKFVNNQLLDTEVSVATSTANELIDNIFFADYSADRGDYPLKAVKKYIVFLQQSHSRRNVAVDVNKKEAVQHEKKKYRRMSRWGK